MARYENCLVGSEAIDFMVSHPSLFNVRSRTEALRLGQAMVAYRTLHHVCSDHDFKDEFLFYRCFP